MLYGSPAHRLEETLRATARVLEIDGTLFWYLTDRSPIFIRPWMYDYLI